jgi:hypothetical protein
MEIEAADAEVAVAAIRAGETRVVGQEDDAAVFYREYGAVDILIVRKGVGKGRKV